MTTMTGALIKYKGPVPGNISQANWRREVLKPSWRDVGVWFHEKRLPLRFTHKGAKLLGYTHRKGEEPGVHDLRSFKRSYTGRKRRKFGHTRPLVWSGESEQLATKIQDVRPTSNSVKIVNHARKLNRHNPKSKVRMADEVRRIAPSEVPMIEKQQATAIQRHINSYEKTVTKKASG